MDMEFVSESGPASNLFADLPKEKPRRLVRWEFIRAAEMFEDVPAMERQVDFQPRRGVDHAPGWRGRCHFARDSLARPSRRRGDPPQ